MYNRTIESLFTLAEYADLGSLKVSPESQLVNHSREHLYFAFDVDGQPFHSIFKRLENHAHLTMAAVLGHRPYTAEDLERRRDITQFIKFSQNNLSGRIEIDSRERIIFKADSEVTEVLTPVVLVSTLTQNLLMNWQLIELGRELAVMSPADLREIK
ncbi:MAG: hypothetical protein QM523_10660 [Candidatus Pacebacteria bacterium]|nr:hypothetical protein [Candidatus Paceibacterota bacterium]